MTTEQLICSTGNPIHVQTPSDFAPTEGYRYGGLYIAKEVILFRMSKQTRRWEAIATILISVVSGLWRVVSLMIML